MLVHMAIGLEVFVAAVPASLAQDSGVLDLCETAGTATGAEEQRTSQSTASNRGVVVDVPIGRVCVGPESVEGEYSYVRRTTVKEGMAIVEVSTTPFMTVLTTPGVGDLIGRTDQPASW